jgi:hypothetical protein
MPRRRKLTPAAVRNIYKSTETAKTQAERFGVSANLVYMIRQGRRHQGLTKGIAAPVRKRGRRSANPGGGMDLNVLADRIIDRLVARLKARPKA